MSRNKILRIVLLLCNLLLASIMVSLALLSIALIWWHIDPEFYSDVQIPVIGKDCIIKITRVTSSWVGNDKIETAATLNNITNGTLYLLYSQVAAIHVLFILALNRFAPIIRSVHTLRTFAIDNARQFKSIGICMFWVFVISGFQYSSYGQTSFYGLYAHMQPLMISLVAFTMSEVFKEGQALLEENRGTV